MKYVLIFNGYPESGKTTFENIIARKYESVIYSSIKPVIDFTDRMIDSCDSEVLKEVYKEEKKYKTNKYRKLLSDNKSMLDSFAPSYIMSHLLEEFNRFMKSDSEFLMIDIREPKNIKNLVNQLKSQTAFKNNKFKVKTVFVKRDNEKYYGNKSDDNVEDYQYDILVNNNKTLDVLENECLNEFMEVLCSDWEM